MNTGPSVATSPTGDIKAEVETADCGDDGMRMRQPVGTGPGKVLDCEHPTDWATYSSQKKDIYTTLLLSDKKNSLTPPTRLCLATPQGVFLVKQTL